MIFDLFHSVSDPVIDGKRIGAAAAFTGFLEQVKLAESLGFDTVWLAESHFSSEVQKQTSVATIPNFRGEVGLNADSFQSIGWLAANTTRINFGTGIHNIVGGSGGPIASADRVNFLDFLNARQWDRTLRIGVASGRFPYQNTAFGIVARSDPERDFWPSVSRFVFLEALEIFLRLLSGEALASEALPMYEITEDDLKFYGERESALRKKYRFPVRIPRRWEFETLQLVPEREPSDRLRVVLGSSDPRALEVGWKFWDLDLFNLSFTPPNKLEALHQKMASLCGSSNRSWRRNRLPRTVLTFIDPDPRKARELAERVLDAYIEAMRGTAQVPDKAVLLDRALIGDAAQVREQLAPGGSRGFHPADRLMLWFEFNQTDTQAICRRMIYFMEEVAAKIN